MSTQPRQANLEGLTSGYSPSPDGAGHVHIVTDEEGMEGAFRESLADFVETPAPVEVPSGASLNGNNVDDAIGPVVFLCTDPGLADAMRQVKLPAVCYVHDSAQFREMMDRKSVIVLHRGKAGFTVADSARQWVKDHCYVDRVTTLDLPDVMRVDGDPKRFIEAYSEAIGLGLFHGPDDFLALARHRAKWPSDAPVSTDGWEDESADSVGADQVGAVEAKPKAKRTRKPKVGPGQQSYSTVNAAGVNEAADDPHRLARLHSEKCQHRGELTLRSYRGESFFGRMVLIWDRAENQSQS
jgi:hypothetical protein